MLELMAMTFVGGCTICGLGIAIGWTIGYVKERKLRKFLEEN